MKSLPRIAGASILSVGIFLSVAPPAHAITLQQLQAMISQQAAQISALQQTVLKQARQIQALNQIGSSQNGIPLQIQQLQTRLTNFSTAYANSHVYALNPYVSVQTSSLNGLNGPHVIFNGVNVHIQSGAGSTSEGKWGDPNIVLTGLGNLVVGYNEPRTGYDAFGNPYPDLTGRGGSHNLIIGPEHKYESYGGFVAGHFNNISGISSSVSGGYSNNASGISSSVSGGYSNNASGYSSNVSGGDFHIASGYSSNVSGGRANIASGAESCVSGGFANNASGNFSSVSGGNGLLESSSIGWAAGGVTNPTFHSP